MASHWATLSHDHSSTGCVKLTHCFANGVCCCWPFEPNEADDELVVVDEMVDRDEMKPVAFFEAVVEVQVVVVVVGLKW